MKFETKLSPEIAVELTEKIKVIPDTEIANMTAWEAIPFWYAVAYLNPGMHTDDADTWGEFRAIAQRIIKLAEDGILSDDQLYPYEATKAGVLFITETIIDKVCDQCRNNFVLGTETTPALDADPRQICLCGKCQK